MERTTAGGANEIAIMYGVRGEYLTGEIELDWLEGYRGSTATPSATTSRPGATTPDAASSSRPTAAARSTRRCSSSPGSASSTTATHYAHNNAALALAGI
jgi:hypothetical protein